MFRQLIAIIFVTASLIFPNALALTTSNAADAFSDLDKYFVQQYSAKNKIIGQTTRPVLIVNGFSYQLYTKAGTIKSFNGLVSPFNELKAVSHLGPAIYTIASESWTNPDNPAWQEKFAALQAKVRFALHEVDNVDWSNPSWPNRANELKSFIKDSLQMVDNQISETLKKKSITQQEYRAFSEHYMHTMVATMYLADVANVTSILQQLRKWKQELGEQEWDKLYVLVMGSKGRTSSELTAGTNTAALTISGVMKPALAKNHIIIMPMAASTEQAFGTLGAIINASKLADITFVTERAKNITGLYKALKTADIPLARDNIVHIVHQDIAHGKVNLPKFKILPKDEAFLRRSLSGGND